MSTSTGERWGTSSQVVATASCSSPRISFRRRPSLSAPEQTYRPRVTVLNQRTSVLVEQIKATDVSRLGRKVGQLSMEELWTVDDAIKDVLGLT